MMKIQVTIDVSDEEYRALGRLTDWSRATTTEDSIRFVVHAVWRKFITDLVAEFAKSA